jgi:hypothetical protein
VSASAMNGLLMRTPLQLAVLAGHLVPISGPVEIAPAAGQSEFLPDMFAAVGQGEDVLDGSLVWVASSTETNGGRLEATNFPPRRVD